MLNHKRLETGDRTWVINQFPYPLLPLFLVSIAVHAALLVWIVPKVSEPSSSLTYTEVEITDLVTPKPITPPTPIPPVAQTPISKPLEPVEKPDTSVSNTIDTPIVSPSPKALPVAPVRQPSPTPKATVTPTPSPSPTSSPIASSDTISGLFDQLASSNRSGLTNASPNLFADPSLFFDQNALKPTILRAIAIAQKSPIQVQVEILQTQAQRSNFQVIERGTYGEGTVYEVRQDSHIWYFNLVPTKDTTGTIVVVWQQDPSRPISAIPSQ